MFTDLFFYMFLYVYIFNLSHKNIFTVFLIKKILIILKKYWNIKNSSLIIYHYMKYKSAYFENIINNLLRQYFSTVLLYFNFILL